jgi:hypothetical protein
MKIQFMSKREADVWIRKETFWNLYRERDALYWKHYTEKIWTKCRDLIVKTGLSEVLNQSILTCGFAPFHKSDSDHVLFYMQVLLSKVFYFYSFSPGTYIYKFISGLSMLNWAVNLLLWLFHIISSGNFRNPTFCISL